MHLILILLLAAAGLAAQDSREILNRGVTAFKNGRYAEAVSDFQQAVDLDPTFTTAHFYLATALMQQYIPDVQSPENDALFRRADAEFRAVLTTDPSNKVALASIASLNLNAKRWDEAAGWYRKLLNVDPTDAAAYYSLAFITWSQWYPDYTKARADLGMKPADPGPIPDAALRTSLRAKWWTALDDAIFNLNQAISRQPQYSDAMAYMNLIVRERADLRDDKAEYQKDIAEADSWVQQALDARKAQGAINRLGMMPPPSPPPPPGSSGSAARIRVASDVQARNLISQPPPVYPPLARQARIEGAVRLGAIIDKDGRVQNLQVISGHPLLIPAAIEAVKQWVYQPTLLNGQPVQVQTEIQVNFTLSQ
ncbi:MAG TPA: TonB family protein [Bryobacteraceae bacterium]|jgi:TonB family protein|nr:TonB family protein [Bryobacteraceae bacterium]